MKFRLFFQPLADILASDYSRIEAAVWEGDSLDETLDLAETKHGSKFTVIAWSDACEIEPINYGERESFVRQFLGLPKELKSNKPKPQLPCECWNTKKINTDTAMQAMRDLSAGMGFFTR